RVLESAEVRVERNAGEALIANREVPGPGERAGSAPDQDREAVPRLLVESAIIANDGRSVAGDQVGEAVTIDVDGHDLRRSVREVIAGRRAECAVAVAKQHERKPFARPSGVVGPARR